jgi:hypothetical protein
MEDVANLVNDHPFDGNLQKLYLETIIKQGDLSDSVAAYRLSFQFVDFDDETWVQWINAAKQLGASDLAEAIMSATRTHPSPAVLGTCLHNLVHLVNAEWNSWTIFKARPQARLSAIRYIEHVIDKSSLWPDSHSVWAASRSVLQQLGESPQSVQKLWARELQAVPMSEELRSHLLNELRSFESDNSLKEAPIDVERSKALFLEWEGLETQVAEYPSMWMDMIQQRAQSDPDEYVSSLHARSVVACPKDPQVWNMYISHVSRKPYSDSLVMEILERAVRNCPFEGSFWVALAMMAIKTGSTDFERILTLGSVALRDLDETAFKHTDSLAELMMMDCQHKLLTADVAEIRECFSASVAVLSEISAPHATSAIISWIHAETFYPKLATEESMGGFLISEFLTNVDFEDKRRACTPLQWIQLAHIFQRSQDLSVPESVPLCRMVYEKAMENLDTLKSKQIVLQDWEIFERTFGSMEDVIKLKDMIPKPIVESKAPTGKGASEKKEAGKKSDRDRVKRPSDREQPEKKKPKREEIQPPKRAHAEVVFVNNLSFSVDEYRLGKFFQEENIGAPKKLVIVRDHTGKSKGFSYVEFETAEQAAEAIKLSGKSLEGRNIVVSPSNRPVTDKKPVVEPPKTFETEKDKTNDYFRNLVLLKQKIHK